MLKERSNDPTDIFTNSWFDTVTEKLVGDCPENRGMGGWLAVGEEQTFFLLFFSQGKPSFGMILLQAEILADIEMLQAMATWETWSTVSKFVFLKAFFRLVDGGTEGRGDD